MDIDKIILALTLIKKSIEPCKAQDVDFIEFDKTNTNVIIIVHFGDGISEKVELPII